MKPRVALAFAATFGLLGVPHAAAGDKFDIAGDWRGAILVQPAKFEVGLSIHFERKADNSIGGTMSNLTHHREDLNLVDVFFNGAKVSFLALGQGQPVQFQGELSAEGSKIHGTVVEGQQQVPFELIKSPPQAWKAQARAEAVSLSPDLGEMKRIFNEDHGSVRLLMVLSPRCSDCRVKAFLIQQYVLATIPSPDLKVYLVWERIGDEDSSAMAREASRVMTDSRVRSFWSENRQVGKRIKDLLHLPGEAAWNVFLMFPPEASWSGNLPSPPAGLQHSLAPENGLPQDRIFDVQRLTDELKGLLEKVSR